MILFKASGTTYPRVLKQSVHAFPYSPSEVREGEFVLLSKNRADCGLLEKQVQNVAKLLSVRPAEPDELDRRFPAVDAGSRWRYIAELYWLKPLSSPFNLHAVPGFHADRYATVQEFARLDEADETALFRFLCETNEDVVVDFINNAEPPRRDKS